MTDNLLLSIEDNSPTALQTFTSVCRWAIYRTHDIWVSPPKFSPDGIDVTAHVMFPDPSSPGAETGMWFGVPVRDLLNDEFWTLVMKVQTELERLRDENADWSKCSNEPILLPPHMWDQGARNDPA